MNNNESSYHIDNTDNINNIDEINLPYEQDIPSSNSSINEEDYCVICLDNEPDRLYINTYFIEFASCNCKYNVHKECFDKWQKQKTRQPHYSRCLICGSHVVLQREYKCCFSEFKYCFSSRCVCYFFTCVILMFICIGY